jgi:hypothetical protein
MKYLVIIIISCVLFSFTTVPAPKHQCEHKGILLIPTDTVDGRPVYSVLLDDGTGLDLMYAEEIAHSLVTGKWQYNEDLRVR